VAGAKTISDLQALARKRLPNFVYEYVSGGADAELTLVRNGEALNARSWRPRMAIDVDTVDLSTSLFGVNQAMPIIVAPTGLNGMIWRHGDLALGRAAARSGIAMAQSTVSTDTIRDVAAVPNLRHWFQLYAYGGPPVVGQLIERAFEAGSEALIVTIDGAAAGNRLWDQRNYTSPGRLNLRSKIEILKHPQWLWTVILRDGPPNFVNIREFVDAHEPDVFTVGRWLAKNRPVLTWDELSRIRKAWSRKLVIKGVLRVDEALKAIDIGADGIVLSNHGGRQAEPAISPIEVLPEIRERLGPDIPILIDSGYRTGTQIAMALAQGANSVLTGRATLYGLGAGGQEGAERAMAILQTELRRSMALVGARSVPELTADLITRGI
jgi:(S)-mandelate dehydrogenase